LPLFCCNIYACLLLRTLTAKRLLYELPIKSALPLQAFPLYLRDMEKIIIIAGPTGVGKSDFAEALAHHINGEIVNADQGQLYEPLTIGTAKPDWKTHKIPHHLFDHVTEPRNCSNSEYQKAVKECVNDIHARGKRAILVGGSGFYYQMLLFDFAQFPQKTAPDRQSIPEFDGSAWEHLQSIDPDRARALHPHDLYRIQRALEIFYTYNVLPSALQLMYKPWAPYHLVHITRDTQELYARINRRTHLMLEQGWLEETASLTPAWKEFARVKKTIGYDDILAYQFNLLSYPQLIETIQQKTRNYAKRQKTYFRSLLKKIPSCQLDNVQEINLTLSPVDLYLNQLIQRLS